MDAAILPILQDNAITFVIASSIVLIAAAVKTATGFLNFYEEFLVKRYANRLDSLSKDIDTDSITSQYIKALRKDEVFRIASGIECSPEKAKMLMEVYLLDIVSRSKMKRLSPYLKPENDRISITVNWFDKTLFSYSFASTVFLFVFGLYIGYFTYFTNNGVQALAGFVVMFIFLFICRFTGRDYKTLRILREVRDRLIELNKVTNPNDSIEWLPSGLAILMRTIYRMKESIRKKLSCLPFPPRLNRT